MFQQSHLVFNKNLKIYWKERQYISELATPGLIWLVLYLQKKNQDGVSENAAAQFLPMSLLIFCRGLVTSMVAEKSERQKEIQKIMGLKSGSYILGWLATNLAKLAFVCCFFLTLTLSTDTFQSNNPQMNTFQLVLSFVMYGLSLMMLAYFITTLFDVPKSGADLIVFLNVIGSLGSQILLIEWVQEHTWIIYILSIIPSFCYSVMPFIQMNPSIGNITFTNADYFTMLSVDILIWLVAYVYADQVIPNEYGTNKHPLFFLGIKSSQMAKVQIAENNSDGNISLNQFFQPLINEHGNKIDINIQDDTSSAIYHESFKRGNAKAVQIFNLTKAFGETQAVNGISLSIYSSQILCLLGHNGAGKTTTISLLTGLIKKDAGLITYYDKNTDNDLDEIRTFIGICPQRDVLYGSLTIEDHLEYYGKIKGIDGPQLYQSIAETIQKCALNDERGKLAKNLSGGNRRKLCLAISIIGNSRVIFLDEPTSGMDPVSRKAIWDILIQQKNEGKCLVLTTHHLDEAEVLSERVAIMAKGKLLTVGSVDFVKKNFGVGYNLTLSNLTANQQQWAENSRFLEQTVKNHIPDCKQNPQTANECLSFQIPFDQKKGLLQLFYELEKDKSIQINLMMNTLEEAFINIGMDEEKFLDRAQEGNGQIQVDVNINDEFAKIEPPECLARSSSYHFSLQFYACFLKKLYGLRGKRLVVQLIIPTFFMIFGPAITAASIKSINESDLKEQEYLKAFISSMICFIELSMGLSIATSSIAAQPVQERQLKQKYSMNVMGCRILPYWLGNYAFDLILYFYLWLAYLITSLIVSLPINHFVYLFSLFLYFCSYISLAYTLSWLFQDFLFAVKFLAFLLIFVYFFAPFFLFLLFMALENLFMQWLLTLIFPTVTCFGCWMTEVNQLNSSKNILIMNEPTGYILILLLQTVGYFVITLLIDSRKLLAVQNQGVIVENRDQDVISESVRIESPACNDRVIAKKISKTYSNGFSAVKGTSFGIEGGQIFGLLGPNGAGKSTTFNMITCRLKPTTGQILLEMEEVEKGKGKIFQHVGICPQFDSLFEVMNPVQHLQMWAYLKGLKGRDAEESVNYFMQIMQLQDYAKTPSAKLSGGNKRKLCVALALMGGSNMQFFDEPSSGVDPIARRFLWNAIQYGVKLRQSAVMLTTHTMQEAESLCSKIAIQINGQYACIGTPQHLKRKFGQGYQVSMTMTSAGKEAEIKQRVFQNFPNSQIIETHIYDKLSFKLQKEGFSFYNTFSFFYVTLQQELQLISDFQLNESSLEQVFMQFASYQQVQLNDEQTMAKRRRFFVGCLGNDEDD